MKRYLWLAVLAGVFVVPAVAQNSPKADQPVRELVRKLADAQLAYDAKTLDTLFTPDYVEVSPAGELDERVKVLGFYKPESKPDAATMSAGVDLAEESMRFFGDTAVVIVRMNYTLTANGRPLPPRSMRATFVCVREKNGWKIASAQYTGIRPPAPAKTN